jgi:hypothetical protein
MNPREAPPQEQKTQRAAAETARSRERFMIPLVERSPFIGMRGAADRVNVPGNPGASDAAILRLDLFYSKDFGPSRRWESSESKAGIVSKKRIGSETLGYGNQKWRVTG